MTSSFAISVESNTFNDFLLIEDKLFIANKEKGLGIFEIEKSYFEIESKVVWYNARVSEDKVIYKQYENEEIIQLTKIPNEDTKIILTLQDEAGKIRYEVIETK